MTHWHNHCLNALSFFILFTGQTLTELLWLMKRYLEKRHMLDIHTNLASLS